MQLLHCRCLQGSQLVRVEVELFSNWIKICLKEFCVFSKFKCTTNVTLLLTLLDKMRLIAFMSSEHQSCESLFTPLCCQAVVLLRAAVRLQGDFHQDSKGRTALIPVGIIVYMPYFIIFCVGLVKNLILVTFHNPSCGRFLAVDQSIKWRDNYL